MHRKCLQERALARRQPVEFVKRVSTGPVSQDIAIILEIASGHQFGEIDELVCRNGKVEHLPDLCRTHRQWRPDVGGGQRIAHRVTTLVGPGAPVVVGFALDVLPVLVVQELNYRVQHGLGDGKPRAKNRSGELQREVGADAGSLQKDAKIGVRSGAREGVKDHTFVDAFGDRLLLDRLEVGECQPLAGCKITMKDQFITRGRHAVDVPEQLVDADPGAVLRIIQPRCDPAASSQLRGRGIIIPTGALDIQDRMAGGTSPLARQFRAELARRAELNVIRKELLVGRVRAAFDNDIVGLQLEAGHVHQAVLNAAAEEGGEPYGGNGERSSNCPADMSVQSRRQSVEIITILKLLFTHSMLPVRLGSHTGLPLEGEAPMRDAPSQSARSNYRDVLIESTLRGDPAVDLLQLQQCVISNSMIGCSPRRGSRYE